MLKRIVACMALMVSIHHLSAQDWILLYEDDSQKNYIKSTFESSKTLDSGGKLITVWTKDSFAKLPFNGKDYPNGTVNALWVIDCKGKKVKISSVVYHNSNGDVLAKQTVKDNTWREVAPQTSQELVLIKACELMDK